MVEKVLLEQAQDKGIKGAMINRMRVRYNGQYVWSALSANEVKESETGGLVDDLVFVEVEVGALLWSDPMAASK